MPPPERPPASVVIIRTRARVGLCMQEGRWSARLPRLGRPDNEQRSSTCTEGGASEIETAQLKQSFSSDRRHGLIGKGKLLSRVRLCDPMDCSLPGSSVHGILQQEYWSGLPFPSPGDLPNPGIKPGSPTLEADALTSEPPGKLLIGKSD